MSGAAANLNKNLDRPIEVTQPKNDIKDVLEGVARALDIFAGLSHPPPSTHINLIPDLGKRLDVSDENHPINKAVKINAGSSTSGASLEFTSLDAQSITKIHILSPKGDLVLETAECEGSTFKFKRNAPSFPSGSILLIERTSGNISTPLETVF